MLYACKEMLGTLGHRIRRFGIIILPSAAIAALLITYLIDPRLHVRGAVQEQATQASANQDWPIYGGDANGDRYSSLTQINRENVKQLRMAWRVDVGTEGGLQVNPLVIGRTIFIYSPSEEILALDAATGKKLWTFDSGVKATQPSRGFSYWADDKQGILFAGVMDHLYALDPATGHLIAGFGDGGSVDLRKDLGNEDFASNFAVLTTPGTIYKDMIIVGFRAPETHPAPHGDIRAYDVHSGRLRWSFHTIPHPGEPGYETWPKDAWKTAGSANNWAGMVVDQQRGIVFAPTGSAVDDFYGADRVGNDLYANTLLALDANTGKLIWYFQGVHHDIWDRDFPSPPVLVTVQRDGKSIDAVAQTSKQGLVYLFERTTGKPLFSFEEKSYPPSTVPGEVASPTQSLPLVPAPFARQILTADMLTNRTPEAHAWAVEQFSKFRSEGQFVPLSVGKDTIVFPGYDGGAEWGGPAVDPRKAVLYVNANDVAWTGSLAENQSGGPGFTLYQSQCAVCHGANRKGSPPQFPSLLGVSDRLSDSAIESLIHTGKGRMSAFPAIQGESLHALIEYLHTEPGPEAVPVAQRTSAPATAATVDPEGAQVYANHCAICHQDNLQGHAPTYPSLVGVRDRLSDQQVTDIVHNGTTRMPPVSGLNNEETTHLLHFLGAGSTVVAPTTMPASTERSDKVEAQSPGGNSGETLKYHFTGYKKFLDLDGYPAVAPPWGTLNAIDLNTGKYLWKIPFGQYPELAAKGMTQTGSENYGGPILTASGLLIIGATNFDHKIRAYNSDTGELLWEGDLPFAGNATPATYMIDGKQYIVIATSGARDNKSPQGAAYVAFALP
jgi:glucose dehydrogenase